MMQDMIMSLARTSLSDPRAAARQVMQLGLSRDILWTALALVAVINTFLVFFLVGTSANPDLPIPGYFERPMVLFFLIAGLTVVYVHAMYWAGQAIGGKGALHDVLAVVVWFQLLRAAAQAAIIVFSLVLPPLGAILSLIVAIWGIWIFLNFLATALNLVSPWHSIAVLVVAFVGLVLGVGVLTALIGGFA